MAPGIEEAERVIPRERSAHANAVVCEQLAVVMTEAIQPTDIRGVPLCDGALDGSNCSSQNVVDGMIVGDPGSARLIDGTDLDERVRQIADDVRRHALPQRRV